MTDEALLDQDNPRTIYLLTQASRGIIRQLDKAFAALPITPIHYTILSILDKRGPLSNAELSRRFFVTAQTMNEAVASLTNAAYLVRTEDPKNRRILLATLTPSGRAILRDGDRIVDQVEAAIFMDTPTDNVIVLRRLMRQLLNRVRLTE
jgi:DNA-binding MarR family transcriptional regulator